MKFSKNILLGIVIILIVGVIIYIESNKPAQFASNAQNISLSSSTTTAATAARLVLKAKQYPSAKELSDIQGYINSPTILSDGTASTTAPFKLADYIGKKVILLDFWTYSCINCIRTIPYLTAWDQKYRDQGLMIVGVHTPEFDFEKIYSNVLAAVKRLGIQYPVVLDSNNGTWNAYGNMYWPHEYVIDIDGFVVHDHIGEGAYNETEQAIQVALKERGQVLGLSSAMVSATTTTPADVIPMDPSLVKSPETYFGAARNEYLGNGRVGVAGSQTLSLPTTPLLNNLYLGGTWNFQDQFAENTSKQADIIFNYNAQNVYLVAAADASSSVATGGVKVKILIDGQPISRAQAGSDVAADGTVTITANRLYSIVNGTGYGQHTLHIQIEDAGLDAFTFTFG